MTTTTTEPVTQLVDLLEIVPGATAARIDSGAGMLRGVKVLGLRSSNGRIYSPAAIRSARHLYEGIRVNIDHPSRRQPDGDRQLADRFGQLRNVRERHDGLYADLEYLRAHPLAGMVAEAAERMPSALGLSHNAQGRVVQRDGQSIVEEITLVRSVDLVSDPATNRSLFESTTEAERPTDAEAESAAAKCEPEDAVESTMSDADESMSPSEESDDNAEPPTPACSESRESDRTVAELEERLQRAERRESARTLLDQHGIGPIEPLIEALTALDDESQRVALVDAWPKPARHAARPRSGPPVRDVRESSSGVPSDDNEALANFLRFGSS